MLIAALIVSFIAFVAIGIPIAFAMGAASVTFLLLEGRLPLALIAQRLFAGID